MRASELWLSHFNLFVYFATMSDPLQSDAFNQQQAFYASQQAIPNPRVTSNEREEKSAEEALWEAEQLRAGNMHLVVNRQMENYQLRMPENSPPSLLQKARSFIEAMVSVVKDAAPSKEVYDERIAICVECPAFEIAIKNPKQIGHCKACGCGKNPMSALAVKAGIAKSSCPKKLWPISVAPDAVPVSSQPAE
ncbi:hypothetical protein UFOVP1199_3 [uncultured Caudovirales phage]|uniref:Uncharacterized protein n=1 Tax=uncultured Caudovirales phage TaxID=2100421 RepID=A0A6J5SQ26_9CAUD|nr:hypothetical protein UFOVP1137_15 [uncultured Caudovirales phage]CAB4189525.1 hypothetical protein UFOVP1199_3 [uncultured Caudovirales phage]CAB4194230.1 hypothetical protein UFOVP1257_14 [uncultured Caudovirales phage]CAB4217355.1 hypothetical protein UFOVP1498_26 [uncultured Caudovirales phage]CAB5230994.1 hypothetical protein UFOVP1587_14 [uncultured Caudovirales phage]